MALTMSALAFSFVGAIPLCMCVEYGPDPSSHTSIQCHSFLPSHHHTCAEVFRSSSRTVVTNRFPDPVIIFAVVEPGNRVLGTTASGRHTLVDKTGCFR